MADRSVFIATPDLLAQIGEGIGKAHENLWNFSRAGAEVGVLAVKDAQVTVSFELTSIAEQTHDSTSLPSPFPLLGAKTFTVTSNSETQTAVNKATIVLNIVNVMPPDDPETTGNKPTGTNGKGKNLLNDRDKKPPVTRGGTVTPSPNDEIIKKLEAAAKHIGSLPESRLPKKKMILKKIYQAIKLFATGKTEAARKLLAELAPFIK